jgi:hypothetical protein
MSNIELWFSFLITWTVILVPPAVIRIIRRRPLSKGFAITFSVIFYFVNIVIFSALGSQSKSHTAVFIGAFFCYFVLRWQTNRSAAKSVAEQRKAAGYDE